jgi:hypothetical protein
MKAARLFKSLSLALLFVIPAFKAKAEPLACRDLYQSESSALTASRGLPLGKMTNVVVQATQWLLTIGITPHQFDEQQFAETFTKAQTALEKQQTLDLTEFKTPESKLALFEATNRHEALNGMSFRNLFLNSRPSQQRQIIKGLKSLSFKKGVNSIDAGDAIAQLYLLNHATPQSYKILFDSKSTLPLAVKELIRLRISSQLLRYDLHSALVNLDLQRADQPLTDSALRMARYSWDLSWGLFKGLIFLDPSFLSLYRIEKTRQIIDDSFAAEIQGDASFERLYPVLAQKLEGPARLQLALGSTQKFLAKALVTVAWAVIADSLWKVTEPWARKIAPKEFDAVDRTLDLMTPQLNEWQRQKLYEDCYKQWRDDFEPFLGSDIDSSEDAKEFRALLKTRSTRDLKGFAYHHAALY